MRFITVTAGGNELETVTKIKQGLSIRTVCGVLGLEIRNGFIRSALHKDTNPSVKIYEKTNSWFDFSANVGGDVIDLWAQYRGVEVKTAIEEMGRLIGITRDEAKGSRDAVPVTRMAHSTLPLSQGARGAASDVDVVSCMSEIEVERFYERWGISEDRELALRETRELRVERNAEILSHFIECCRDSGWNNDALAYMQARGFSRETIYGRFAFFNLYDTVKRRMTDHFAMDELRRSGLFNDKSNIVFARHRILIIYTDRGRPVYLRGRYFDQDNGTTPVNGGKYIGLRNDALNVNTATRFYNFDAVREGGGGDLFMTEGEFDAELFHQQGYRALGIPGVGNLPADRVLKRLEGFNINFVPDNDVAGEKLRDEVVRRLGALGMAVVERRMPGAFKDMTEYVTK